MKASNGNPDAPRNAVLPGMSSLRGGSERKTEKQLLQSQRLEALGTLVGGIAHDFNNILGVITGHVSLMERWRTDPERFMKSYDAVKKATERGASTAKQLLTFVRELDVVTEQVNMGDAIREIVGLLKGTFPENIVFETIIEPGIPGIAADSHQIHQALLNLCVNSRDAMPDGGTIKIIAKKTHPADVRKRQMPGPDNFVQVTVSDTGPGMKKEVLGKIFEPFFTTKGGFGTGIGLAVVYGIMKAHGGLIDVESVVGQGTSFSLYFPVSSQSAKTRVEKEKEPDFPNGHGEVILAIEDEEQLKAFLKTILTESGYKVLLASNGLEGLQTYRDHMKEIALVLLDMGLPEMSGTEVLTGLLMLNPSAKVISASSYLDPNVEADALEIGALAFLPKPYMAEELLTKVHRGLQTAD